MSSHSILGSQGVASERSAGGPAGLGWPLCSGLPTYRALDAVFSGDASPFHEPIARRLGRRCLMVCRAPSGSPYDDSAISAHTSGGQPYPARPAIRHGLQFRVQCSSLCTCPGRTLLQTLSWNSVAANPRAQPHDDALPLTPERGRLNVGLLHERAYLGNRPKRPPEQNRTTGISRCLRVPLDLGEGGKRAVTVAQRKKRRTFHAPPRARTR